MSEKKPLNLSLSFCLSLCCVSRLFARCTNDTMSDSATGESLAARRSRLMRIGSSAGGSLSLADQAQLSELLAQFPDAPVRSLPRPRGSYEQAESPAAAAAAETVLRQEPGRTPKGESNVYSSVFGTPDQPLTQCNEHYIDLLMRYVYFFLVVLCLSWGCMVLIVMGFCPLAGRRRALLVITSLRICSTF
jgi:hypothetical protein